MYRYAQINDDGFVVSDSHLSGEVKAENMIPLDDNFDLENKRFVNGNWEEYIPGPAEAELEISSEEIQAQILLTQAEISAKQAEQDEVLAEILLNQIEGGAGNV